MISYQRKYYLKLFMELGGVAAGLHRLLTANTFKNQRGYRRETLDFLHNWRPFVYYADPNSRLSHVSIEIGIGLQLCLMTCLRWYRLTVPTDTLKTLRLVCLSQPGFPVIGLQNQHVVLYFVANYPNQGMRSLNKLVGIQDQRLKDKHYWPRWIFPSGSNIPVPSRLEWTAINPDFLLQPDGRMPLLATNLPEDLDPGKNRFTLDMEDICTEYSS